MWSRSAPEDSGDRRTLSASFLYFEVCFCLWVLLGPLILFIQRDIPLSLGEKGLILAMPMLSAAIFRVVGGIASDYFGPKRIGIVSLLLLFIPLIWGGYAASSFAGLLLLGLLLGIAGGSFAVALPLVSRCYPPSRQGVALGIAAAGNSGTVIASLAAPPLAERFGWHAVFILSLIPLTAVLILFLLLARDLKGDRSWTWSKNLSLFRSADLFRFSLFYSVTFGGFIGFAAFLGLFFHDQYGAGAVAAGQLSAITLFAGSLFRPVGGYLADRFGGARVLLFFYSGVALALGLMALIPPLPLAVGLMFLALTAAGMGNGAVFQLVSHRFSDRIGAASGIVGAAGGIGGFLLPSVLGILKGVTGSYAPGFLLFSFASALCLALVVVELLERPKTGEAPLAEVPLSGIGGRVAMEVVFDG